MITVRFSALVLTMLLALTPVANAQVLYGSIVGLVEDPTGGTIPEAKVTATNPATGLVLEATTDATGNYTILNVLPGSYDIKITKQGFKTQTRTGVVVSANVVTRTNVRMDVGALTEQVTVQAEAVVLQTDKADTHTEITSNLVKSTAAAPTPRRRARTSGSEPAGSPPGRGDRPERP